MFDFLEKLREKPPRVKKQIAFFTAIFFAGIIFVIWLSSVYPNIWKTHLREEKAASLEPGPVDTLGGIFSEAFTVIGEKISEAKKVISSFASSTEYYASTSTPPVYTASSSPTMTSSTTESF